MLSNAVNNQLRAQGATRADEGFAKATQILQSKITQDGEDAQNRTRVVIHVTDGEPGDNGFDYTYYWDNSYYEGEKTAADVLRWAKILKNDLNSTTDLNGTTFYDFSGNDTINQNLGCGATVYAIGIFNNLSNQNKTNEYMWRSSSNTKTCATNGSNYGPNVPSAHESSAYYYLRAENANNLNTIFDQISRQISNPVEKAIVRDYIAPGFELYDPSTGNTYRVGSVLSNSNGTLKMDEDGRYYVEWSNVNIQIGQQFTATIFVRPKSDFIGGNNLPTNIENISGVYDSNTGECIASFPVPKVNVPILPLPKPAKEQYIYIGDVIDQNDFNDVARYFMEQMLPAAYHNLSLDNTEYSDAYVTITYGWIDETSGGFEPELPENETSSKVETDESWKYQITVQPLVDPDDNPCTTGTKATKQEGNGTYTVVVHGAELSAQNMKVLMGRTVDLTKANLSLDWGDYGEPNDLSTISYTFEGEGVSDTSIHQISSNRSITVKAYRKGKFLSKAAFEVIVGKPGFNDATYNILLGESVGERYEEVSNYCVTPDYTADSMSGAVDQYNSNELDYQPDLTGYGTTGTFWSRIPIPNSIPSPLGAAQVSVPVNVYYKGTNIQIGLAYIFVNVYMPSIQGRSFDLLKGEQAKMAGYTDTERSSGIQITYPDEFVEGYKGSLRYEPVRKEIVTPETFVTSNRQNTINVYYGNTLLTPIPVIVNFTVHVPVFTGNTFNLFYGETVQGAYEKNTIKEAIGISRPSGMTLEDDRWEAYLENIVADAQEGYGDAMTKVHLPGQPSARFPVTVKYEYEEDGVQKNVILTTDNLPEIIINVTAGTITIQKTVTVPQGMGTMDQHQTFLFKIIRTDGNVTEESYEYITGNGSKTISGLKKGTYEITEMTDWSWRYQPAKDSKTVTLGRGANPEDDFITTGSVTFKNEKNNDSWLGDEAKPEKNDCGTVPNPDQQQAKEMAILPGKREDGMPEEA